MTRDPRGALAAVRRAKDGWIDDSDTLTARQIADLEARLTDELSRPPG